jgi:hypothetical protein
LISYICDYRNSLSAKAQEAFNDRWGFHTLYLNSNTVLSLNRLLKDSYSKIGYLGDISALIKLHRKFLICSKEYEKELKIFQNLSNFSRGYRLLHLFQLELMHPISASIFTAYEKRIHYPPVEIANLTRLLGVLCLLGFYIFMLYIIFLFGSTQSDSLQIALCESFFLWIVYEILLVESLFVYLIHILVPSSIAKDLQGVKTQIMNLMYDVETDLSENQRLSDFSICRFINVSSKIIKNFPALIYESKTIIPNIRTPYKLNEYLESFYIIDIVRGVPIIIQDTLVKLGISLILSCHLVAFLLIYWWVSPWICLMSFVSYFGFILLIPKIIKMSKRKKISPDPTTELKKHKEIIESIYDFQYELYCSDDWVILKDSFLLDPEFESIDSIDRLYSSYNPDHIPISEFALDSPRAIQRILEYQSSNHYDSETNLNSDIKISDIESDGMYYEENRIGSNENQENDNQIQKSSEPPEIELESNNYTLENPNLNAYRSILNNILHPPEEEDKNPMGEWMKNYLATGMESHSQKNNKATEIDIQYNKYTSENPNIDAYRSILDNILHPSELEDNDAK